MATDIYALNADGRRAGTAIGTFAPVDIIVAPRSSATVSGSVTIDQAATVGATPESAAPPLRGRDDGLAARARDRPL